MSFLICPPSVCVINDQYEILLNSKQKGIFAIKIKDRLFYAQNSGVLSSEKKYAKIRVKQSILDKAKGYQVVYRQTIDRKAYFSEMGVEQTENYNFYPITKTENINVIHIADVHYAFSDAKKVANYFGKNTDLYVFNGDIGEVETDKHYTDTLKFVGNITRGEKPILFVRGNHDTRGKLAEKFTEYYPSNGQDTFYSFTVGNLTGIVLDCGEDKVDDYVQENFAKPYNGVNKFHEFRDRQLKWLKKQVVSKDKLTFAISHICPVITTVKKGDIFDIERDIYTAWNAELERLNVKFMLTGHLHRIFILLPDDERSVLSHNYPVIVGSDIKGLNIKNSKYYADQFVGSAITVSSSGINVKFIDKNLDVLQDETLIFK